MLALFHTHYNFARIHQTLRVTPAMGAGISLYAVCVVDSRSHKPLPAIGTLRPLDTLTKVVN